MGYISKLDAVNMLFLGSGQSPIVDLNEARAVDNGVAEFLLDEALLGYQLRGQLDNSLVRYMRPDNNGRLLLSYPNSDYTGVITAELQSVHTTPTGAKILARVQEGNPPRMYNMTEGTDAWRDDEYQIRVEMLLRWDQLETAAQRAIMSDAMQKYQMLTQSDRRMNQLLAEDEAVLRSKAKSSDSARQRRSILENQNAFSAVIRPQAARRGQNYDSGRYGGY